MDSLWVPQDCVLEPVLFNVFINNLKTGQKGTINKVADDTKLEGVGFIEGRDVLQTDRDKLEG